VPAVVVAGNGGAAADQLSKITMVPRESIYARYTCGRLGMIMNFGQAIASGFKNYIGFEGRACRSEYWFWTLFFALASVATVILDSVLFSNSVFDPDGDLGLFNILLNLALFLPSLALVIRRLHDINSSGWWILPFFIPIIGIVFYIGLGVKKGFATSNQFGDDPLAPAAV
jgi:uncharacterized membrane protein YhaH (DUF805 family)